jgi:hypothetical protein
MSPAGKVVYTSKVRIERERGPMRQAYLPAEKAPVVFGVHSEIAEHYKVPPEAYPPMQRHSTMWLQRRRADSREPLEVRWMRARSTPRKAG